MKVHNSSSNLSQPVPHSTDFSGSNNFMNILPTSISSQKVIPVNGDVREDQPLDNDIRLENQQDPLEEKSDLSSEEDIDPLINGQMQQIGFFEKWQRKIQSITYRDVKLTARWLLESAKIEIVLTVSHLPSVSVSLSIVVYIDCDIIVGRSGDDVNCLCALR